MKKMLLTLPLLLLLVGCGETEEKEAYTPVGDVRIDAAHEAFKELANEVEILDNDGRKVINVDFAITDYMYEENMLQNIDNYLEKIADEDFSTANFSGQKNGEQLFYLSINKEKVDNINFDKFDYKNLPDLAEMHKPY